MPYAVATELTPAGADLLVVVDEVGRWLTEAPGNPVAVDNETAGSYIKSLAEGWASMLIGALAEEPRSLTELARDNSEFSYPSLERRLTTMRRAGHVEAVDGDGRATPYSATRWLRRGLAPLMSAARFERRHLDGVCPPITPTEVEAAFMLVLPAIDLPASANGRCNLVVKLDEGPGGDGPPLAGVMARVEWGAVSARRGTVGESGSWALGTVDGWIEAVADGHPDRLRFGGEQVGLSRRLVRAIRLALR